MEITRREFVKTLTLTTPALCINPSILLSQPIKPNKIGIIGVGHAGLTTVESLTLWMPSQKNSKKHFTQYELGKFNPFPIKDFKKSEFKNVELIAIDIVLIIVNFITIYCKIYT